MSKIIFDYDNGDYMYTVSNNMAINSDGDIIMRMSDNMAIDTETGDIHFIGGWFNEDDEEEDED